MISRITKELSMFFGTDQGATLHNKYDQMRQSEGWSVHQDLLVEIANGLLKYMVTKEFTKLDKEQKDVEQRAIFECKDLIDFLLDPLKGLKQHNKIAAHNKKMAQTAMGGPNRK